MARMVPEVARLLAEAEAVYAFVFSRVERDQALAEDLTQETFLAAMGGGFEPERGLLRGWLFGIALRKIVDHQRRRRSWFGSISTGRRWRRSPRRWARARRRWRAS
ncbi:MAG: hypothetical protein HYY16_00930 [Planctomycetes bacterium]|nr:hypothetical protein [Planctomycetota bacterium]